MTGRNTRELLHGILDEIVQISRLTEGRQYENFYRDEQAYGKVTVCIRAIGEMVRGIPTIVRVKYALVPWNELGAFEEAIGRVEPVNRPRLVWKISTETLPRIRLMVEDLLKEIKT
ncbi:MAG: hypothetical protein WAK75_05710 [Methanoregula sp.]|uniref:HepT-like ribonuclease domain-containing protein n=1 Tax=Methanoregula sp. TaxID=2052170 RepID=UPI003BAF960B